MSDALPPNDAKVGYKRPPAHTRFQKGRSGNPRGRQKGVRNFAADVKRTLELPVTLNENGKATRVSTQEALVLRLREKALKGDARALESLLALARSHNNDLAVAAADESPSADDQLLLDAYLEEVRSRPTAGLKTPTDATVEHLVDENGQTSASHPSPGTAVFYPQGLRDRLPRRGLSS